MPISAGGIRLGACVRDITPSQGVPLAGFAHRKNVSDKVHSRLYLRAFVFEDVQSKKRAAVVSADIIGWDAGLAGRIESSCQQLFKTDCVILNATHTHSGPCVLPLQGTLKTVVDPLYLNFLAEQVVDAVGAAYESLETVEIRRCGIETSGLVVSRRLMTDQGMVSRPNQAGHSDHELIVWKFQRANGTVAALWIHYACHPTILSGDDVSSEYMGRVVEMIEEEGGGAICAFFQGCAGDVRPHFVDGRGFFRSTTIDDLENFARSLTGFVRRAISSEGELVEHYDVAGDCREIVLHARGASLCVAPVDIPIRITSLKLARNVGLIAYPGEPSIAYQKSIKAMMGLSILPLGYSNGFPGYLPTATQIREGGYESVLSCPLFGLPGPFDESVEERLLLEAEVAAHMIGQ